MKIDISKAILILNPQTLKLLRGICSELGLFSVDVGFLSCMSCCTLPVRFLPLFSEKVRDHAQGRGERVKVVRQGAETQGTGSASGRGWLMPEK